MRAPPARSCAKPPPGCSAYPNDGRVVRIGLISDTHMPFAGRTMWDEVDVAFRDVELILHAGDIVHPAVLDRLEQIAPVLAARGNNDVGMEDPRVLDQQVLEL